MTVAHVQACGFENHACFICVISVIMFSTYKVQSPWQVKSSYAVLQLHS